MSESPAPETGAADTSAVNELAAPADSVLPAVPQAAAADSSVPAAKPAKKKLAFKPGKIVFDRNGRIFLAATAGMLGVVYLAYQFFRKDVR